MLLAWLHVYASPEESCDTTPLQAGRLPGGKPLRQPLYAPLDPLFSGTIALNLIAEQWDRLVRVAASLKDRIVSANVIIMKRASCLRLLSNAVLVYNTLRMTHVLERAKAQGQEFTLEDIAHISPLAHRHIIVNATYDFSPSHTCNLQDQLGV